MEPEVPAAPRLRKINACIASEADADWRQENTLK
jgi:hypothetical protein